MNRRKMGGCFTKVDRMSRGVRIKWELGGGESLRLVFRVLWNIIDCIRYSDFFNGFCVMKDIYYLINICDSEIYFWDNWNLNLIMNLNLRRCFFCCMLDNRIYREFLILFGKGEIGFIIKEYNYVVNFWEIYIYKIYV